MIKKLLLPFLLLFTSQLFSQTNVRAWYAEGQVWVVWEAEFPLPDWYAVYAKPTAFTSTTEATRVGKLHKFEYSCIALKEQVDTLATPRIPSPTGVGIYQLQLNEALFVFTPHQPGALFFAVVADDETVVNAGQNITAAAVPFDYDPVNDPVECHLQALFPSPFAAGYTCMAFLMWADGRQNQWENRPDFPVMANAAKNGMPGFFFISFPNDIDTTQPFPLSVWLHGGGGTARQSLAGSRAEVNIKPEQGILLAHNDDMMGWRDQVPPNPEQPTWHFGWRKNYDPFTPDNLPTAPDTIVNYTQRRYLWIDSWLIRNYNIDPGRIHIHGHSMGSVGATALAKCYSGHYASATIFNNGFGPHESSGVNALFGEPAPAYPTNLINRNGETVYLNQVWNLIDNCSEKRDLPLFRHWHSKNDDNGTMRWDAYVIENFRKADSLGIGVQHMWSERNHGMDTGPDYNDHWIMGIPPDEQTVLDNVSYPEARYRSNQSFPAFFNHRLDPQNNDPGTGIIGINNGDGDNWGAWGGWHRWEVSSIVDEAFLWSVTAWLEENALFPNDICPHDSLTADLAIRRPQVFTPPTGVQLYWIARDIFTNEILQSGTTTVQEDDLAVIPQVVIYRADLRLMQIEVSPFPVATQEAAALPSKLTLSPNPSSGAPVLTFVAKRSEQATLRVSGISGLVATIQQPIQSGENRIVLSDFGFFPAGFYFVEIEVGGRRDVVKWVKI
ncbi:MAG: T9SS type A sorting domain-containing protein [Saprospiraceae bacterium]|nr:T9SS type A sorting domain-containing protein [Saprospiraceae bacterium]